MLIDLQTRTEGSAGQRRPLNSPQTGVSRNHIHVCTLVRAAVGRFVTDMKYPYMSSLFIPQDMTTCLGGDGVESITGH